jgi:hypothetical protein
MITSNARAEFTTKTTIIVVLACAPHENMAAWLAQRVVWGRSMQNLAVIRLGGFHEQRAEEHARLKASNFARGLQDSKAPPGCAGRGLLSVGLSRRSACDHATR